MDLEVRQQGLNPEVVYDLLHVVARFGREVVDRVRVDQAITLRAEPEARLVIKRSRWLLLRNRDNLKAEQAIKLEELLAANRPLATVYLLKLASERQIAPLIRCAKRLAKYRRGTLASAIFPMNSSVLEGESHQGYKAHGLRLSGRILLLPKNQGRVPRQSAMNLFLARAR